MNKSNEPAFPVDGEKASDALFLRNSGLTKREYFAGLAMSGLAACPIPGTHNTPSEIARTAIEIADELLKQLD